MKRLILAAAIALAACRSQSDPIYVLYADQPTVHVISRYSAGLSFDEENCRSDQRRMAFRYPTITFHCDREQHG